MAIVETRRITKLFDEVRAVDGIDLIAREGEFLVLLGPSGCGKTTLMRLIAGLERPTSGEIVIDGNIVTGLPPRARNVAMVFQSYALYPHLTVEKNISFPLRARGMPREAIRKKVAWAAQIFGIQDFLDRKPRQLSGGERQRVALARALYGNPFIVILDEPNSNLDGEGEAALSQAIEGIRARNGIAIVIAHRPSALVAVDLLAIVQNGRIASFGPKQDVLAGLQTPVKAAPEVVRTPMRRPA